MLKLFVIIGGVASDLPSVTSSDTVEGDKCEMVWGRDVVYEMCG